MGHGPWLVPMSMTVLVPCPPVGCIVSKCPLCRQHFFPATGIPRGTSHCAATRADSSTAAWQAGLEAQEATHCSTLLTRFLADRSGRLTQQQSELLWMVGAAAVVTGTVVKEVKESFSPPPPTPKPTPARPTPVPTKE